MSNDKNRRTPAEPAPASTGREKIYQVWQFGVGGWRDTTRQEYDDTQPGAAKQDAGCAAPVYLRA